MTTEEITALAREYGEYVADNPIAAPYLDTDEKKDINIRANANRAKDVIKWMANKFCLVEKDKAIAEYRQAKAFCDAATPLADIEPWSYYTGRRIVLKSLFPEIAKEVES